MRLSLPLRVYPVWEQMSVKAKNFYRRALPESCVDFASKEGKRLFTESLQEGYANIYFKLASQFLTQDEPAYCGLSTLVMVLNSLEVDPERVWKAPWRFYHESMLDCCVPLENVKKTGINLAQFSCLAMCNRLETCLYYAEPDEAYLDKLRKNVISSVRGESTIVVSSYDRSKLDQTGAGHFSPLAAYHSGSDSVLIMDVARFKYPPHWITLKQLQTAMNSVDPSTKKVRGFLTLRLKENSRPLVMFGLKCNLSHNEAQFADAVLSWKEFLLCDPLSDAAEELTISCRRFAQCFAPHAICCTNKQIEGELEKDSSKCACKLSEVSRIICEEVRQTSVGLVFQHGAVAALMLAWPFDTAFSDRSERLKKIVDQAMEKFSPDTQNEIAVLRTQIVTLIGCSRPPIRLDRGDSTASKCSQHNQKCCCRSDVQL